MSWLRQRATEVSLGSTVSEGRPASRRARLVRVTRSDSDDELNESGSQAKILLGAANVAIEVIAKTRATASTRRRDGDRPAQRLRPAGRRDTERSTRDIQVTVW